MKDKIERQFCAVLFEHPVREGVPAFQCTEYAIEGKQYCEEHKEFEPLDTIEVKFPEIDMSKQLRFPSTRHNDTVDANAWAFRALEESMKKTVLRPAFIYSFLFFFLGFGVGLFAAYMIFLFTWMN